MLNAWTYRIYRCTKSLATFLTVWNALPIILRGRSPPWSFSRGLPSFDPRLAGMTRANPYGKPAAFPKIWQVGKPMITIFLTTPDRSFAIRSPCRIISLFFAFFFSPCHPEDCASGTAEPNGRECCGDCRRLTEAVDRISGPWSVRIRIPSGKRLRNYGKIHRAING